MLVDIDAAGLMILVYVVPLSLSMTIFYVWILQALNRTTSQLEAKQQHEKIKMFKRLKFTLGFSIALLLLFFVANSITISGYTDDEWISNQWKSRWFMVDGWLALLFFTIFLVIAILWRPTQNNQRYGLQQLAQDEVSADALDLESRYNAQPADRSAIPGATTGEVNPAALHPHVLEDDEGDIFDIGGDESDEDMIPKDQRNRS
jgi:magnesium-transporting ATPase (P-type)